MITTTRWKDKETDDFSKVMNLLVIPPKDEENEGSTIYTNWEIEKTFENNEKIMLNGKAIEFNLIRYSYDQIWAGDELEEERTSKKEGIVIPYYNGSSINYIINRNHDAQRILRKLLKYSGKKEIAQNKFSFDNDFFIWLINKVYTNDNVIEVYNEDLHNITLYAIKGFKGNTEDLLTKVSADGESVMNIISTLSFFLESRNFNQITLNLGYHGHQNIALALTNKSNNGLVSIAMEQYQGVFEDDGEKMLRLSKLLLLIYIEIIPILIQDYKNDLENDVWSESENINFLLKVAEDLSDKVKKKVESLPKNKL